MRKYFDGIVASFVIVPGTLLLLDFCYRFFLKYTIDFILCV